MKRVTRSSSKRTRAEFFELKEAPQRKKLHITTNNNKLGGGDNGIVDWEYLPEDLWVCILRDLTDAVTWMLCRTVSRNLLAIVDKFWNPQVPGGFLFFEITSTLCLDGTYYDRKGGDDVKLNSTVAAIIEKKVHNKKLVNQGLSELLLDKNVNYFRPTTREYIRVALTTTKRRCKSLRIVSLPIAALDCPSFRPVKTDDKMVEVAWIVLEGYNSIPIPSESTINSLSDLQNAYHSSHPKDWDPCVRSLVESSSTALDLYSTLEHLPDGSQIERVSRYISSEFLGNPVSTIPFHGCGFGCPNKECMGPHVRQSEVTVLIVPIGKERHHKSHRWIFSGKGGEFPLSPIIRVFEYSDDATPEEVQESGGYGFNERKPSIFHVNGGSWSKELPKGVRFYLPELSDSEEPPESEDPSDSWDASAISVGESVSFDSQEEGEEDLDYDPDS